ncbi:MAG: YggS family pyridoxal phosphate-dependent enzyme [Chloroflexota bacterium]|nr:YggS family pyridoxal phosphate-dependent enzyme [Chloroflexota bacterium]
MLRGRSGHTPVTEHADVVQNAHTVMERVAAAAERSGRDPDSVRIVAVAKTEPRDRAVAALHAGIRIIGENRVQEAVEKWDTGLPNGVALHMVGRLQRNKARRGAEVFDMIHSCDSLRLVRSISQAARAKPVPVLLEVNMSGEPSKAGFAPTELPETLEELLQVPGLQFDGLMTIAPAVADPEAARPYFATLARLSEELRSRFPSLGPELSMGMTNDYEVAVEEGATLVRIGRAIYGERRLLG